VQAEDGAHYVGHGVGRPDLVEVHTVRIDPMDGSFSLSQAKKDGDCLALYLLRKVARLDQRYRVAEVSALVLGQAEAVSRSNPLTVWTSSAGRRSRAPAAGRHNEGLSAMTDPDKDIILENQEGGLRLHQRVDDRSGIYRYEIDVADTQAVEFEARTLHDYYQRYHANMTRNHRHSFYQVLWFRTPGSHFVDFTD
jgi:hypothetical protein